MRVGLFVSSAARCALLCTASMAAAAAPPILPARATALHQLVSAPLIDDDSMDVPGINWLEHLNLLVGPREDADKFFCEFLGCVPEPGRSWHVNMGSQQFHLGEAAAKGGVPHVLTGSVGVAVPSLAALRSRVARAARDLAHTRFDVADHGDFLCVVDPWGSNYVCRDAQPPQELAVTDDCGLPKMARAHIGLDESFGVRGCGLPGVRHVEFRVRPGTAARVGRFYEEVFGCRVSHSGGACAVLVGPSVHLVFHEVEGHPLTDDEERAQAGPGGGEGLHLCVYIERFKPTFERLHAKGLVATNPRFAHLDTCGDYQQAVASRQFRFKHIVDLETGEVLLELEHEVRAQRHFQYFKRTHFPEGSGL